ncbi:MAG: hypothetical protein FWF57_00400 [Defluviitaleaceae bacterium]|nr:hypothetical protein [Defluviitaleaceae bacterium]
MKSLFLLAFLLFLVACGNTPQANSPQTVEPRAVFSLDRVYIADVLVNIPSEYEGSRLTFVGPEAGGNVLIQIGEETIQASINPSREHPSFESGYWHHHLYAGNTEAGSRRISFLELLPNLNIDVNPDATDNTQSSYQHGNLHYVVETGEYRLRFTINGEVHDLFFVLV